MVPAFAAGQRTAEPVVPQTLITVLSTGDPGLSYVQPYDAVVGGGGTMIGNERWRGLRTPSVAWPKSRSVGRGRRRRSLLPDWEELLNRSITRPGEVVVVSARPYLPARSRARRSVHLNQPGAAGGQRAPSHGDEGA
ncbi:MAG: hypothetical protein IPK19_04710 [Chloroflexi bacterium]|nr:hypothetical protein [Chloroflexota bacterium]